MTIRTRGSVLIISITGKLCCGKSTIAQYISQHTLFPTVDVGHVVRDLHQRRTSVTVNKTKREVLQKERDNYTNPDWLWNALFEKICSLYPRHNGCIITGIREPYLLYQLFDRYQVKCITVEVSDFTRYCRLLQRDGYVSPEDFYRMNSLDEELGLPIVLTKSDFVFSNEYCLSELDSVVERMLLGLKIVSKKSHIVS